MIGVWSGTDITSKRCWIRRPDGPAAVSLGKDLKTAPMSKFGSSEKEPARTLGMMGISDAGFLAFNNCQVASLLGAMPLDSRVRQAFIIIIIIIITDPICFDLLFHAWYIDDGVIAGSKQAVVQALSIIQDLGPPLGLVINSSKCELYGDCDLQPFPSEMKKCKVFNFEILGAPIGDTIFCARFIAEKRAGDSKFLALLKEVGSHDSQVALVLLRQCGGFCRFVHIARCTPPSLASEGLHFFDIDVHQHSAKS